ncbi:MAG: hypothetical protein KDC23_08605 [Actinobacteria bacterium]|nr:hypothetical protein [Actinomycetota bacterium]
MTGADGVSRLIRGATQERAWAVVVLQPTLDDLLNGAPPRGFFLAAPERDRFWADPFPVRDAAGDLWIFVEEYLRWRGLGRIVALRVSETGQVVTRRTVLASSHHFSFPQVHLNDGTWVATVESCDPAAPTYTFTAVGEPWIASLRTLPVGVIDPAIAIPPPGPTPVVVPDEDDPTTLLDPHGGQDWYLTGTSGSDEFAGFRQWVAPEGVGWIEQPEVRFRDAVLARPAGNLDLTRGLRSTQDCSENYGVATSLVTWDPAVPGPGEVRRRIEGTDLSADALGTHTLAWTPDGAAVVADVWRRRRQPLSAVHRILEQRHGRLCPGRRESRRMP